MKYRFAFFAAAAVLVAGVGVSQAEAAPKHYSFTALEYFSGEGFMSHFESYGGKEVLTRQSSTAANAQEKGSSAGHQLSPAEFLYFSGEGFSSGNK